MSLFDSFKGAIFEEEAPAKQDNTEAPSKPHTAPLTLTDWVDPPGMIKHPASATIIAVPVDPAEREKIRSRVIPPSGSLVTFLATVKSLEAAIPDEATRVKAAASVLSAQGMTIERVLGELDAVQNNLIQETTRFNVAKGQKYAEEVTAREARCAEITKLIDAKSAEIAQLVAERDSVRAAGSSSQEAIEKRAFQFSMAIKDIASEYTNTATNLKRFLGGK